MLKFQKCSKMLWKFFIWWLWHVLWCSIYDISWFCCSILWDVHHVWLMLCNKSAPEWRNIMCNHVGRSVLFELWTPQLYGTACQELLPKLLKKLITHHQHHNHPIQSVIHVNREGRSRSHLFGVSSFNFWKENLTCTHVCVFRWIYVVHDQVGEDHGKVKHCTHTISGHWESWIQFILCEIKGHISTQLQCCCI